MKKIKFYQIGYEIIYEIHPIIAKTCKTRKTRKVLEYIF